MEDFFQFSVFDTTKQPFKIDKPIRLIELFAGIGSQAKALERLGVDFEHHRICEFDKYAVASYNAVHGTNFVTSDITKITAKDLGIVDTYKYLYMMTYSFPCQDLSLAGKQKGMSKGSGTRSGLLWEVERLLNECDELPQVLIMENVTQVHGKKNKEHFDEWIKFLESLGYSNYWKDLNANNFGIPQNRNRTFMVSILGNYTYEFPKEFPLELRLKDMLEDSVDEKYYLSDVALRGFEKRTRKQKEKGNGFHTTYKTKVEIANTLTARYYKDGKECLLKEVDTMQGGNRQPPVVANERFFKQALETVAENDCSVGDTVDAFNKRVNKSGIAPTVKENRGTVTGVVEPLAYDEQNGYIRKDGIVGTLTTDGSSPKHNNRVVEPVRLGYIPYPNSNKAHQSNTFYDENAISQTLDTCTGGNRQVKIQHNNLRIRKLTPKECWRLMGFDDADFEKASQYNSNSQLYKQAGNSIVVDVLYYIFKQMFAESEETL